MEWFSLYLVGSVAMVASVLDRKFGVLWCLIARAVRELGRGVFVRQERTESINRGEGGSRGRYMISRGEGSAEG